MNFNKSNLYFILNNYKLFNTYFYVIEQTSIEANAKIQNK